MYRGTTPTLPIRIHGQDLTLAKIYLSVMDSRKNLIFTLTTPGDFTVTYDSETKINSGNIRLTQEQTLALSAGHCEAQVKYIFPDGTTGATPMREVGVKDAILKEVITYD